MDTDMDTQADPSLDMQEPDEARPAKRVRLDGALDATEKFEEEMVDDEGWDDIYGTDAPTDPKSTPLPGPSDVPDLDEPDTANPTSEVAEPPSVGQMPHAPTSEGVQVDVKKSEGKVQTLPDGVPPEAVQDASEDLVPESREPNAADEPSVRMLQETSGVNDDPNANLKIEEAAGQTNAAGEIVQPVENEASIQRQQVQDLVDKNGQTVATAEQGEDAGASLLDMLEAKPEPPKATEDPEFMAAATQQKGNENAEWQYDTSDAESSSSDSDSDSDSSSEDDAEALDPATMAKMLMAGDGDDDDGGKGDKSGADNQPRTANEVKEEIVTKPDITITPNMKVVELGKVETVVENMILIRGFTPGEYQVLEAGSVLCNEKHQVIGVVGDTFGKVQEPMYSVAFTNAKEIEDLGLQFGAKVYYVQEHSTFVFTQPLKNMKGTDASNIHDEEVGEDEMEFSDDEAEAEHKRQKKLAKRAARGGMDGGRGGGRGGARSFGAPGHDSGSTFVPGGHGDVPQSTYGGGLSYDDEDASEGLYNVLKRPDNLSELMASGGPPARGGARGGRGRGDRGRGRGDRGRGRGGGRGQDGGQRGGRGGFRGDSHQIGNGPRRGNANSFPDRHNSGGGHHDLPPKPHHGRGGHQPSHNQHAHQQAQQYANYGAYQHNAQTQQQPGTYQFGGYTFQYPNSGASQGDPQQAAAAAAAAQYYAQQQQQYQQPNAGAYVNPAFYQQQAPYAAQQAQQYGQQAQWGQWAAQQQGYGQPGGQQQQAWNGGAAPTPQQQANLDAILKQMGGGGGGR